MVSRAHKNNNIKKIKEIYKLKNCAIETIDINLFMFLTLLNY